MSQPEPTPEIRYTTPSGDIRLLRLEGESLSLGRSAANTLCFPEDDGLSRRHLVVEKDEGRWVVRNLASKNGTYVNGVPVDEKHFLQPGDQIVASTVNMSFSVPSLGGRSVTFESPVGISSELSAESTSLRK